MRLTLFPLLLLAAIFPASAQTPEEQAVLAPIHAAFDAMAKHDPVAFQHSLLPGGAMVLMRGGVPRQMTFAAATERLGKPDKTRIEERIHDPVIHIDNDLAVVWASFDFLVDGKVDHCGTDLFSLVRNDGKWLITAIADTAHATCPAQ